MGDAVDSRELQDDIALKLYEDSEEALADILRHYAPPLMEWLKKKYVYDDGPLSFEDVEDIVCIAVRKLWDARKNYDDRKASVRTLLFTIADNTAKDVLRSGWHKVEQRRTCVEPDWLEDLLMDDRYPSRLEPNASDYEEDADRLQAVRDTLSGLTENHRRILEEDAKADGEANSAELGKRLGGVPAGTVRVWRCRAKAEFREGMKKRGYDVQNLGE